MRVRTLLIGTAIVSSILGAVVVYLTLTVPNDLEADSLLKEARKDLAAGETDRARATLARVVQQHPRTDAAAAATVALVTIADQDNEKLRVELTRLRQELAGQSQQIEGLGKNVETIKNAPPKIVTVQAPPPPKPAPQKVTPKKTTPRKQPTTKKRRG